DDATVSAIDLTTGDSHLLARSTFGRCRTATSHAVYWGDDAGTLLTIPLAGGKVEPLALPNAKVDFCALSLDEHHLAISTGRGVFVYDLDKPQPTPRALVDRPALDMRWSEASDALGVMFWNEIGVYPLDGTAPLLSKVEAVAAPLVAGKELVVFSRDATL